MSLSRPDYTTATTRKGPRQNRKPPKRTSRDLWFIVIQFNDAYLTGDMSLSMWGVASWRVSDTEAGADWVSKNGLAQQTTRFQN